MIFWPLPIQKLVQGQHPIQQIKMHSYFPLKIQMKPDEEADEDKFLQQEPKSNLYKWCNDWLYHIIDTKTTEIKFWIWFRIYTVNDSGFWPSFLSELALVLIQLEIDPSGLIIKLHYKSLRGVLLLNLIILMDLNCLNSLGQLKLGREIDPKVIQVKKSH